MSLLDLFFNRDKLVKKDKDYTDEAVDILSKKGIVDPRVYDKNLQIRGSNDAVLPYSKAYVEPDKPSIVNLVEPNWRNLYNEARTPYTLAHELEHSTAYSGGAALDTNYTDRGRVFLKNYATLKGIDSKNTRKYAEPMFLLYENASNPDVRSHLKKNYGIDTTYLGSSSGKNQMSTQYYEELAADLGAVSKLSKKDIFSDPFLQEKLFNNDPYLMEAVRSTLHVEPRMDAKDIDRLTPYPQNIERFKKLVNVNKKAYGGITSVSLPEDYKVGGRVRMI